MRIVVHTLDDNQAAFYRAGLERAFPSADVIRWLPGVIAPADYALVWRTPPEFFLKPRVFKAVFALGAGVDGLLPFMPTDVPLIRLDDAGMAPQMTRYVVSEILRVIGEPKTGAGWARDRDAYERFNDNLPAVTVLGLGVLGARVARTLCDMGFTVHGWSRTPKVIPGMISHVGDTGLAAALKAGRIVVNLLPLTSATENLMNERFFASMAPGGYLINVARGGHVVEADLIDAVRSGQLAGATLDVLRTEPIASDHPFLAEPRIRITPHVSARTLLGAAVEQIVSKIRMIESGASPRDLPGFVRREVGY